MKEYVSCQIESLKDLWDNKVEIWWKIYNKPPIIEWWWIFDKDRLKEIYAKRELKHIYAWVSWACDLNCIYCQTKSWKPMPWEMNLEERKKLMDEFKELWGELVHIAWRWEPTYDPIFWDQLKYIKELWLKPLIFTHWAHLNENNIKKLKDANASIILKVHSLEEDLQDWFAAKKWYTKKRDEWLKLLIENWFNKWEPTKLWFDILVMKKNLHEIEKIFRFCRENNIFPLVKPFLKNERWASKFVEDNLEVSANNMKSLYVRLAKIDREEYGYWWRPSPPYAWIHCNYYLYHIMVTIMWDVAWCIWLPYIWNIRDKSLKEYWNSPEISKVRNILDEVKWKCASCILHKEEDCYWCPCRKVYKKWPESLYEWSNCFDDIL